MLIMSRMEKERKKSTDDTDCTDAVGRGDRRGKNPKVFFLSVSSVSSVDVFFRAFPPSRFRFRCAGYAAVQDQCGAFESMLIMSRMEKGRNPQMTQIAQMQWAVAIAAVKTQKCFSYLCHLCHLWMSFFAPFLRRDSGSDALAMPRSRISAVRSSLC
jgi:hypothetical protein